MTLLKKSHIYREKLLTKVAAPRWMKEIGNSKDIIKKVFNLPEGSPISPFGSQILDRLSKSLGNRKELSKYLGMELRPSLREVSMQNPLKRSSYFKHNNKTYQVLPFYTGEITPQMIKAQTEKIKKYLPLDPTSGEASRIAEGIRAFKEVNPKGTMELAHATNAKPLGDLVRTPSAASDLLPLSTVYSHPANIHNSFYGRKKMLYSRVPLRDIIFQGATTPGGQIEAITSGKVFNKGVLPKRRGWHYHPENPEMLLD